MAARSKACVCGRSLAGAAGSKPAGGLDVCRLLSVVCCQAEVSVTGRSLVQRSHTEGGLSVITEPQQRGIGPLGAVEPRKNYFCLE